MLVKLASKLTKMWHTLGPEAKALARTVERPTERFVSGIERGNHQLIEEMKRKKPGLHVGFKNELSEPKAVWNEAKNSLVLHVAEKPNTLRQAISKRHEVFEGQQMTGTKGLGRRLKKFQKRYDLNNGPHTDQEFFALGKRREGLEKHMETVRHDPNARARFRKINHYLERKEDRNWAQMTAFPNPNYVGGHANAQVLFNESKLVRQTPGALEEYLKLRNSTAEIEELKKKFNFNY